MNPSSNPVPAKLHSFTGEDTIVVRSPGRINLIGEHTDYNEGFVLPAAIDKAVYVTLEKRNDQYLSLHSIDFNETIEVHMNSMRPIPGHWATYILGVVNEFKRTGRSFTGFTMSVYGDVPLGAGLSSSAALECAAASAINEAYGLSCPRKELAMLAQRAEHEFAGVKCGIMDQFASLFGKKHHVLKLDCRSLEYEYFPLQLDRCVIVLVDSNVKHSLASSEYNTRREQCEAGVHLVQKKYPGVKSLRDVTIGMIGECLTDQPVIYDRCLYVVQENMRLLDGCNDLRKGDIRSFGKKMFGSHHGLSKLYEVSCPELDFLVRSVQNDDHVIGARMMGGGFGGCTINLVKEDHAETFANNIESRYRQEFGKECKLYRVSVEDGTTTLVSGS